MTPLDQTGRPAVHSGTSGFAYKEWKGDFYPDDMRSDGMLGFYAARLNAVEINNTFYRLPKASVLEAWTAQVPAGFRFAIKASRRITHFKRLKDAGDETGYLLETARVMGDRLGVVLFQLPPNMKRDDERLADFLALLPAWGRYAFEFRHDSWEASEVLEALGAANCALVASDTDETAAEIHGTADWGYLRLRRTTYTDDDLADWARRVAATGWAEAFVFFKHEDDCAGPAMAARFLELSASEGDPAP